MEICNKKFETQDILHGTYIKSLTCKKKIYYIVHKKSELQTRDIFHRTYKV